MKPRCTICILLTLVAVSSDSFIQCLHVDVEKKGENWSLWDFFLSKRPPDGDEALGLSIVCIAILKKKKVLFFYHLGLLHFSGNKVLIFFIVSFEGC